MSRFTDNDLAISPLLVQGNLCQRPERGGIAFRRDRPPLPTRGAAPGSIAFDRPSFGAAGGALARSTSRRADRRLPHRAWARGADGGRSGQFAPPAMGRRGRKAKFARLREEVGEQSPRGADPGTIAARAAERREAIDREERPRIAELRQKSAVQVRVKLASFMVVNQPKLRISAVVSNKSGLSAPLEAVWDALTDAIEPIPCPSCGQPTFAFRLERNGLVCASCPPARHAIRPSR